MLELAHTHRSPLPIFWECITMHFFPKILSKRGTLEWKTDCIEIA